jgi:hypothetical protein
MLKEQSIKEGNTMKDFCTGCFYWSDQCCNYFLKTGQRRGCPSGQDCLHYKSTGRKRASSSSHSPPTLYYAEDAETGKLCFGPSPVQQISKWSGIPKNSIYVYVRTNRIRTTGTAAGCRFKRLEKDSALQNV